jgi:hypothetical protein
MIVSAERPAAAEDGRLGAAPWYPLVDPEVGPQETLEQNTLAIVRLGDNGWRVNRGKYRSLVSEYDFYKTVGRGDLAMRIDSAASTARTLFVFGAAGMTVGLMLLYANKVPGGYDPSVRPGLIVFGAGLATFLSIYVVVKRPDIGADDAVDMAERYNRQLKAHIERDVGEAKPKPVQAVAPRIFPWTDGQSGGGLVLLATF